MLSGIVTAVVGWWVAGHQLPVAYPDLSTVPRGHRWSPCSARCSGCSAAAIAPEPRLVAA